CTRGDSAWSYPFEYW
nr:immunoglobulin heavy chain junction region [Macaca mulatta]MOW32506.1 immunoglobulin heavy chain junction region [Macaca mulatta]MOW32960.1 immunoglobulin heavy chain junction region [Macaca mulatta]MOW32979.1 immunoglobulin heavy chain junction region [Macaca mulatta]MOW33000.1 immunoglobulin heavy chain junction region [Macaca mulatta]